MPGCSAVAKSKAIAKARSSSSCQAARAQAQAISAFKTWDEVWPGFFDMFVDAQGRVHFREEVAGAAGGQPQPRTVAEVAGAEELPNRNGPNKKSKRSSELEPEDDAKSSTGPRTTTETQPAEPKSNEDEADEGRSGGSSPGSSQDDHDEWASFDCAMAQLGFEPYSSD